MILNRETICLNGIWQVDDSIEADRQPERFGHTVPVPGLVNLAEPAFPDAGHFATRDFQFSVVGCMVKTEDEIDQEAKAAPVGKSYQERNYFWYRRTFQAPAVREHAVLNLLKAQFGAKIWLNGTLVGENDSSFTSHRYDLTGVIRWGEENEILLRLGAHPGVLPLDAIRLTDFEKYEWMPGIWDDIEIYCFDGAEIRDVQIAPKIDPKEILAQTTLRNAGKSDRTICLKHIVRDAAGRPVAAVQEQVIVPAGSVQENIMTIALPEAELWCPENPALYTLETEDGGDSAVNRFGLREFRFDTATRSAYLNGKKIFLRGADICLHRFFEDPVCRDLPWQETWVRQLLGKRAKAMHWNVLKLTIGPVPRRWYELADEIGMMLISEFPVWTLSPGIYAGYVVKYDLERLKKEMIAWLKDIRNYASQIYFNASLESDMPEMTDVVREIRKYDLSGRAWSNSWNEPAGPDDPLEDHQYEFNMNALPAEYGFPRFDMKDLEKSGGFARQEHGASPGMPSAHPVVLSEYGWLFLGRNGNPTALAAKTYPTLQEPHDTPEERFLTHAYLHAGLTEYWRAFRHYAGVIMIAYLAWGDERNLSSDYLLDPEKLQFHPYFEEYVGDAFKPLGVYVDFWHREVKAGSRRRIYVMLCNDTDAAMTGELIFTLENEDGVIELGRRDFLTESMGQQTIPFWPEFTAAPGKYTLKATAVYADGDTTVSRRWVEVTA